jgi:hypothetical protein
MIAKATEWKFYLIRNTFSDDVTTDFSRIKYTPLEEVLLNSLLMEVVFFINLPLQAGAFLS